MATLRHTRQRLSFIVAFLVFFAYLASSIWPRLASHRYDLSIDELYNKTLAVYLLSTDCKRYTSDIMSQFDDLDNFYIVNDVDSPECLATGAKLLNFKVREDTRFRSMDDKYRLKWAYTMQHCAEGSRHKCMLLEDDVIFIHPKEKTKEVIITNTLTLWFAGNLSWDCARRGFGWIQTHTHGLGSQCRVYEKNSRLSMCMAQCLIDGPDSVDMLLGPCQSHCTIDQGNFLLVQHSELETKFIDRGRDPNEAT